MNTVRNVRLREETDTAGCGQRVNLDRERALDLHDLLARIQAILLSIAESETQEPALAGISPERWEDDEYVYIEAGLPGLRGPDIDINISMGKAFIRLDRTHVDLAPA